MNSKKLARANRIMGSRNKVVQDQLSLVLIIMFSVSLVFGGAFGYKYFSEKVQKQTVYSKKRNREDLKAPTLLKKEKRKVASKKPVSKKSSKYTKKKKVRSKKKASWSKKKYTFEKKDCF